MQWSYEIGGHGGRADSAFGQTKLRGFSWYPKMFWVRDSILHTCIIECEIILDILHCITKYIFNFDL